MGVEGAEGVSVGAWPQLPHPLSEPEGCVGCSVCWPMLIPAMVFCTSTGFVSGVICIVGDGATVLKNGVAVVPFCPPLLTSSGG